jgi:hypothetical protein
MMSLQIVMKIMVNLLHLAHDNSYVIKLLTSDTDIVSKGSTNPKKLSHGANEDNKSLSNKDGMNKPLYKIMVHARPIQTKLFSIILKLQITNNFFFISIKCYGIIV